MITRPPLLPAHAGRRKAAVARDRRVDHKWHCRFSRAPGLQSIRAAQDKEDNGHPDHPMEEQASTLP
jgi:hypothetical protein